MQKMSDGELFVLCQKYGGEARRWKRKFATLLPEVEKRRLWEKKGFYSLEHFAKVIGGMGESTVRVVLSVYRRVEDKPLLKAEIEKQGFGKVGAVASLPLEEEKLVEMVQTLSKGTLEKYRKDVLLPGYQPVTTLKIDKKIEFRLKKYRQKLGKQEKRPVTLKETLSILLDQVEEKPMVRKSKPSKDGKRYISASDRCRIEEEYDGRCAMCDDPYTEIHHPDRFAKYGTHKRLVPLCKHHHQMAHAGLIENEYDDPRDWRLRDQMQPNSIDRKYVSVIKSTSL